MGGSRDTSNERGESRRKSLRPLGGRRPRYFTAWSEAELAWGFAQSMAQQVEEIESFGVLD